MHYDFTGLNIEAKAETEIKAAKLLSIELEKRTGVKPNVFESVDAPKIALKLCGTDLTDNKDCFIIEHSQGVVTVRALTIRGLIFGYSRFLRKCEFKDGKIILTKNIAGKYIPDKKIRGHQIGYRTTPNTYDAWDYDMYFRYYLDMMAFSCNTCEHIPYETTKSRRNSLMKYDEEDFLVEATRLADEIDLDVSLWHPNSDDETEDEAVKRREKLYNRVPRIDAVFPPGGDPGELYADEFIKRCKKISTVLKETHPGAEMWPSAQAPHIYPDWGEALIEELKKEPDEIDGLIMGPNHAYPMHELRKLTPSKYPLRFYPDITHNVRCEYPVHFLSDDWHYSLASTLSRESVNPRPLEFSALHRIFSPYTVGSVSYSEGVHDDLNKMVWSDLEFDKDVSLRDSVLDYARFFMYNADSEKIADGIFSLEKNWDCDPLVNPSIDNSYRIFGELKYDYPHLSENWRFMLLYFRSMCDKLVLMRRKFETELIDDALFYLKAHDILTAEKVLTEEFPSAYNALRSEIDSTAKKLFELIGIQLDVEHYGADNWERGATLDTIDNPVTDRLWLINRINYAKTLPENEKTEFIERLINRNKVDDCEYYYSVALHELKALGVRQNGEFYMDFMGDKKSVNNGAMPMSMLKVYDHFSFDAKLGGFEAGCDYILKIAYKKGGSDIIKHHKITANGVVIYDGKQYGGEADEKFDRELLAPGFVSASYSLPAHVFINGTLELSVTEPIMGFKICEFWILKAKK